MLLWVNLFTTRIVHRFSRMDPITFPDEKVLEQFGYRQELKRTLGYFLSFALSFSVISVTTGLFANYGDGLRIAGPAFIWTWLVVGAGQFLVALVFARLAAEIPLSGYAYHWTRRLAGPQLAWWAGWLMIIQFLTGMPGVCYALANYLVPYLGFAPSNRNVIVATVVILGAIALINHFGILLASWVNNVSVVTEILGTVLVGLLLLCVALWRHTKPLGFLLTHPAQPGGLSYIGAFAFSSLMSAWTLTGFESAANLSEETHDPTRIVPRAIVRSEVFSVIVGFLVLAGFTLAIYDLKTVTGDQTPLRLIMDHYFPPLVTHATMFMVFISIFASALANLTTLTRMVWAMARDGQLPVSPWLARVSVHRVPARALWSVTLLSMVFVMWAKLEVVITGIATLAGYLTYAVVLSATLRRKPSREISGAPAVTKDQGIHRSRALAIAALVWTLILVAMLSLPHSARINSLATLAAIIVGGLWFAKVYFTQKRPAI